MPGQLGWMDGHDERREGERTTGRSSAGSAKGFGRQGLSSANRRTRQRSGSDTRRSAQGWRTYGPSCGAWGLGGQGGREAGTGGDGKRIRGARTCVEGSRAVGRRVETRAPEMSGRPRNRRIPGRRCASRTWQQVAGRADDGSTWPGSTDSLHDACRPLAQHSEGRAGTEPCIQSKGSKREAKGCHPGERQESVACWPSEDRRGRRKGRRGL